MGFQNGTGGFMSHNQKALDEAAQLNQQIGQRLRALRIFGRVSQKGLGDALGVSFQQVQKYENGSNRLSAARLLQVADFLDVPVMTFFDGLLGEEGDGNEAFDKEILRTAANINAIPDPQTKHLLLKLIRAMARAEGG